MPAQFIKVVATLYPLLPFLDFKGSIFLHKATLSELSL